MGTKSRSVGRFEKGEWEVYSDGSQADDKMELDDLRNWAKSELPNYKLPTRLKIVPSIPKNAMGKVNKKDLVKVFE